MIFLGIWAMIFLPLWVVTMVQFARDDIKIKWRRRE